jgi:Zinc-binding dehydrogenase
LKDAVEDPAVTYFDRMGVGMLVVDEAHLAKIIRLNSERQGLPLPAGSRLAEAILARTDHVRSRHGDGAIVMATVTPVTNSPCEMWVAARLRRPPRPRRRRPRASTPSVGAVAGRRAAPEVLPHKEHHAILERLADHLASGDVVAVLDRTVDLEHVPEAIRDLAAGRIAGKAAVIRSA